MRLWVDGACFVFSSAGRPSSQGIRKRPHPSREARMGALFMQGSASAGVAVSGRALAPALLHGPV